MSEPATAPTYPTAAMAPAELVALLDESDPVVRAFDALVILHPEHLTPVSLVKGGAA
ncbi:hypothetical protein [Streptomyces atriruber]|uniref:hypothetical protein n=1 Tax=Streptomyces atriruber TaxID=545121 RepID=UPI000AE1E08F|nr:hypothetical protein [Streptomyces atriruber]